MLKIGQLPSYSNEQTNLPIDRDHLKKYLNFLFPDAGLESVGGVVVGCSKVHTQFMLYEYSYLYLRVL